MTLTEFEKLVEICFTRKVEAITTKGRKKRTVVERPITAEEAIHIIASEFGFNLIDENDANTEEGEAV